jgi:hypothetical protein
MDKKEHLTDEEFEKMMDDGYDFDDVIGQRVQFKVLGMKHGERWDIEAVADFALSVDGLQWAEKKVPITTTDDDYDSALATAMLAMANAINSPRFLTSLRKQLNEYTVLSEAKEL